MWNLTLKCTKFDFGWGAAPDPAGKLTALPWPLAGEEGDWLPLPLLEPQSTQCREPAKYVLIRLHCTSKMHIRSFIGGARAAGIPCFYTAARPPAALQETN